MAKTIMTVDDSPSVRQLVSFALKDAGYETIEAEDGQDAVRKLAAAPSVSLVVTDLHMPNMDGLQLIREIRQSSTHKFVPIVMLTTESKPEMKNEGRSAGASGWIVKPFEPPQLVGVVKKLLG